MTYLAVDVHYSSDNALAVAAGLLFAAPDSEDVIAEHLVTVTNPAQYTTGEFYKRELPCILTLLSSITTVYDTVIVDSYVDLGERSGMGRYLYESLNHNIAVIGVAKNSANNSRAIEVLRGGSKKPLYVTAVGVDCEFAAGLIESMHGQHRQPTLLKRVDVLARCGLKSLAK